MTPMGKQPSASMDVLVKYLGEQLEQYLADMPKLSLRERVLLLIDLQGSFRRLGRAVVAEAGFRTTSARGRIRQYFAAYPGQVIDGAELAVVAGISEYARRVRELRKEGFRIITGPGADPSTNRTLRPDQYLYLKPAQEK